MDPSTEDPPERELLRRLMAGPVSGDALARASGQTRTAVWKRIQALREAGVEIQARPGRGYALASRVDLLDAGVIHDALPETVRGQLASLAVRWSLESTNTGLTAWRGGNAVAVLLAERQTGGRGRRGRHWASPAVANLYLSLARGFEGGLARLGGLSLVAGVAVADALQRIGLSGVRLKWPNDIVVEDEGGLRKLGGILVEGGGEHAGPVRAVIGLGLNVRMPASVAAGIDQPWVDVSGLLGGESPPRNVLAAQLLAAIVPALQRFDMAGLGPFMAPYADLDVLRGRPVVVQAPAGEWTGVAAGLSGDGALRVRRDDGVETCVHAGEVSVRGAWR